VRFFYERYTDSSWTRGPLDLPTEHYIDVLDVAGEQRFELPLTNAELTAALTPR
jgi:hypothetical protein